MRICVLTSMFSESFPEALLKVLREHIPQKAHFAFVASEFELLHEKTDKYFHRFLAMFVACGITFAEAVVVDGRMTPKAAQETVRAADVVWLSGGDTPVQYAYLEKYGLVQVLREHTGIIIGMSAGTINMAETAVCTRTCGHAEQQVYPALGLVPFSTEPHFDKEAVASEVLEISQTHVLYGLCDEAAIVFSEGKTTFIGDVFRICGGCVKPLSTFETKLDFCF